MRFKIISTLLFLIFFLKSCNETYTPRPTGYFRISLPEKKYISYKDLGCPFSFEVPAYAQVANYQDSIAQPCWKYIRYPQFNGELFLSYKEVNNNLNTFLEDAHTLAYKHTVKADAIDETVVETGFGNSGIIYDIGGSAASPIQFFVTDSSRHFLRGALYFNFPPQPDSLAPVIEFLRHDVLKLMTTIEWK